MLFGKKILIIMPKYYGYEYYIQEVFTKLGAEVYLIYENIDFINYFYRFVYVYMKQYKTQFQKLYYERKLKQITKDIDVVFVIRGSSLNNDILEMMKRDFSKAEFIMYQWDSVKNNIGCLNISQYFEKIFTFDKNDAKKFGWQYRPLFYVNELCCERKKYLERSIDVTYIGLLHSQRAKMMCILKEIEKNSNLKFYFYLYLQYIVMIKHKYFQKDIELREIKKSDIEYRELSVEKTNEIYKNSKIIFDYTHPEQEGFTMRTIESIGHECKIITNNIRIKNADFYNENNVYIYENDKIEIPKSFLDKPYTKLSDELYYSYSLEGWVKEILGEEICC